MDTFIQVTFLLVVFTVTFSYQLLPCSDGNCSNSAVYLGLKWGPKVICCPDFLKLQGTNSRRSVDRIVYEPVESVNNSSDEQHIPAYIKTISESSEDTMYDSNSLDYLGSSNITRHGLSSPPDNSRWHNYFVSFDVGALNLSRQVENGLNVKQILSLLSDELLRGVTQLSLSSNNIGFLPPLTFPFQMESSLQTLLLDNNPLNHLSSNYSYTSFELSRLSGLRVLNLARTGLSHLDPLYLSTLEILDLSDNQFSSVPASLEILQGLQELYLAGNQITVLTNSSFSALVNLRILSLAENRLQHIVGSSFQGLGYLHMLYLNKNLLKYMPEVNAVTTLYLGYNPWQCSYALMEAVNKPRYYAWVVVDRDDVMCTLGDEEMSALLLRKNQVCVSNWDWLKAKGRLVVDTKQWFHMHGLPLSVILTIVGWVIIILSMALIVCSFCRSRNKEVPYSVLDGKNVV